MGFEKKNYAFLFNIFQFYLNGNPERDIYILYPSTAEVPALYSLDTPFHVPRSLRLIFKMFKIPIITQNQ